MESRGSLRNKRSLLAMATPSLWLIMIVVGALTIAPAWADGLTKEQGDAILQELRQIKLLLQRNQVQPTARPRPQQDVRVELPLTNAPALGNDDAPVVLVEFTDYECPYCKRFYDAVFPELKEKYIDTGKLRFISRNFPLPMHSHAEKAAQAAACADEQGKYWQMRASLFANPRALDEESLYAYAKEAGIDAESFRACLNKNAHALKIKEDLADGNSVGISGTPSFVLGRVSGKSIVGQRIVGAQPLSAFAPKIQALLSGE